MKTNNDKSEIVLDEIDALWSHMNEEHKLFLLDDELACIHDASSETLNAIMREFNIYARFDPFKNLWHAWIDAHGDKYEEAPTLLRAIRKLLHSLGWKL